MTTTIAQGIAHEQARSEADTGWLCPHCGRSTARCDEDDLCGEAAAQLARHDAMPAITLIRLAAEREQARFEAIHTALYATLVEYGVEPDIAHLLAETTASEAVPAF